MKRFLLTGGIFTGIFGLSFSAAFFSQYKKGSSLMPSTLSGGEENTPVVELTDKQKVLNSLLEIQAFEVNGDVTMLSQDNTKVNILLNAQGDLSDLENIQLEGDLDFALNGSHLKADFGYFENELFFSYNESYFRLETEKLLDFVSMLPTKFNIGIEIPSEFSEMELSDIESYFDNMSDKQITPDGKNYYFTIELSEKISLDVITDLDLNFAGFRTNTIDYNGMLINAKVSLDRKDSVHLTNPKNNPALYAQYQDFEPAFKLFDGFYALTQEKKNTINADLIVRKENESTSSYEDFLSTNLDITYNLEDDDHLFALDGSLNVNNVETPYSFALYQKCIYAHYGDVAFSIELDSVTALIDYIFEKIGDEKIVDLINSMSGTMSSEQIADVLTNVDNILGTVTLTSEELGINLNTSNFSSDELAISDMYVSIKFNSSTGDLEKVSIINFVVGNYQADLVLSFDGYKAFSLDNVEYQKIDHLLAIADIYEMYAAMEEQKFRLEFDATVSKEDEVVNGVNKSYNDITIDGGLQFELDKLRGQEGHSNVGYGYGDVTITDRNNVQHQIKADMKNVDQIYLQYSTVTNNSSRDNNTDSMRVKMKVQTLKDIAGIFSTIIEEQDDHFQEIMTALLGEMSDLPITEIMDGNYLTLLSTNLIDRFEVGDDYLEADIALDIVGMQGNYFTLRVDFATDYRGICDFKDIKIYNFNLNGLSVEFNAYLKQFDESLESSRLSPAEEYIDFSDLNVLLQLGINTSKNNYYHFTANANVKLSILPIADIDLPLDIKVWTNHGDVKVSVDFTSIPTITAVNKANHASDRSAHIYYHDGFFYVNRIETIYEGALLWKTYYTQEHIAKYNLDDFMDNILEILLGDVVCLSDTFMDMINGKLNSSNDSSYQMKYENILNDFLYSKSGHYFYFDINLAEVANNDQLSSFNVKILTDNSDTTLTGVNVNLCVNLTSIIALNVSLDLNLADCSLVADDNNNLTALDAFEARMAEHESGFKLTTRTAQ